MAESLQLPSDAPPQLLSLGQPEQIHPSSTAVLWGLGLTGLLAFLPAGMCFLFVAKPFGQNPPPPEVALAVGCVFALAGLAFLLTAVLMRLPTWIVFPKALVELKGGKFEIFAWHEIAEFRQEAAPAPPVNFGPPPMRYTLVAADGRTREIANTVRQREALAARIMEGMRGATRHTTGPAIESGLGRADRARRRPGEVISAHAVTLGGLSRRYAPALMLGGIGLALGVGFLIMSVFRPDAGALAPGLVISLVSLFGFTPIVMWGFGGPSEAVLREDGVLWRDAQGERLLTWDQIREVYRLDLLMNNTFRKTFLKLVGADGTQVQFDHRFAGYDAMADYVVQRQTEACLEAKQDELDEGRAVFGKLALENQAIGLEGEQIPWGSVQFTVWNGVLVFRVETDPKGKWREYPMCDIPNVSTFLMLADRLGQSPEPPATFLGRR